MAETPFVIGAEVSCTDGVCGKLVRVVVDPVIRAVTQLVVQPRHWPGLGRLVPLDLVEAATPEEIRLRCTQAEFDELGLAEATHFAPRASVKPYVAYSAEQVLMLPYYRRVSSEDPSQTGPAEPAGGLPPGQLDVRRNKRVYATDGEIGRVEGLVIDPGTHHVSHVLLQEGHLSGRREAAVPIGAVTSVLDGVQLNLTKQQVEDLPPVTTDRLAGRSGPDCPASALPPGRYGNTAT